MIPRRNEKQNWGVGWGGGANKGRKGGGGRGGGGGGGGGGQIRCVMGDVQVAYDV